MNLMEFVDVPCGVLGESRTICMPGIFAHRVLGFIEDPEAIYSSSDFISPPSESAAG